MCNGAPPLEQRGVREYQRRRRPAPFFGRSSLTRLPDRLLKYGLTALAAAILALIAYFFVRLYIEAHPAFARFGVFGLHVRQQTGTWRRNIYGAPAAARGGP